MIATALPADSLITLYGEMLLIRRTEQRLSKLFADGEVPGFIHLGIGQEAVAVGVARALERDDTLASNHRGHGHALAKGMSLDGFFHEVMGRAEGICGGRGGSMHVADMSVGMLGANGIVGAGLSLALGSALALKIRGTRNISSVFFGDGAMAEGLLHETLNLAQLWKLPLLLVCENNGWAEFSPSSAQIAASLQALAGAYGIAYERVDGNDIEAVHACTRRIVAGMRAQPRPCVLECQTVRVRGHYEGDAQKYRDSDERVEAHDPLVRCRERLLATGIAASTIESLDRDITARIEAAVGRARVAGLPDMARARADVYTARAHH